MRGIGRQIGITHQAYRTRQITGGHTQGTVVGTIALTPAQAGNGEVVIHRAAAHVNISATAGLHAYRIGPQGIDVFNTEAGTGLNGHVARQARAIGTRGAVVTRNDVLALAVGARALEQQATCARQRVANGDRAAIAPIERQRGTCSHIHRAVTQRTRGTTIAHLQRTGVNAGIAAPGVGTRQRHGATAVFGKGARTR